MAADTYSKECFLILKRVSPVSCCLSLAGGYRTYLILYTQLAMFKYCEHLNTGVLKDAVAGALMDELLGEEAAL